MGKQPPKDVEPTELAAKFLSPAPSELFEFTRYDEKGEPNKLRVRVQLLRTDEMHGCLIAAQQYAKTRGELPKEYGDVYREAQAIEVVWRSACEDEIVERPDGTKYFRRIFANAEQCRQALTEPEVAYLINLYELVKSKYSVLEDLDEYSVEQWINRLGEGMNGALFLGQLDSRQWAELLLRLAQWARNFCQTQGYQLESWLDSSESETNNSDPGTSSPTKPPDANIVTDSGPSDEPMGLPTDRVLNRDEARDIAKKKLRPRKRKKKKR